jgi:hypothetical protein
MKTLLILTQFDVAYNIARASFPGRIGRTVYELLLERREERLGRRSAIEAYSQWRKLAPVRRVDINDGSLSREFGYYAQIHKTSRLTYILPLVFPGKRTVCGMLTGAGLSRRSAVARANPFDCEDVSGSPCG